MDTNNLLHEDKVSNFIKVKNLWTDSERKWALDTESKHEIEGILLHHKDMSNYVNCTTNSNGH